MRPKTNTTAPPKPKGKVSWGEGIPSSPGLAASPYTSGTAPVPPTSNLNQIKRTDSPFSTASNGSNSTDHTSPSPQPKIPQNPRGKSYSIEEMFAIWESMKLHDELKPFNSLDSGKMAYQYSNPQSILFLDMKNDLKNIAYKKNSQNSSSRRQSQQVKTNDSSNLLRQLSSSRLDDNPGIGTTTTASSLYGSSWSVAATVGTNSGTASPSLNNRSFFGDVPDTSISGKSSPSAPPGLSRAPSLNQFIPPEAILWVYLDPQGKEQGPFEGTLMHTWYNSGYLQGDLQLRRAEEHFYRTLSDLVVHLGTPQPFILPLPPVSPIPPPINQSQSQPQSARGSILATDSPITNQSLFYKDHLSNGSKSSLSQFTSSLQSPAWSGNITPWSQPATTTLQSSSINQPVDSLTGHSFSTNNLSGSFYNGDSHHGSALDLIPITSNLFQQQQLPTQTQQQQQQQPQPQPPQQQQQQNHQIEFDDMNNELESENFCEQVINHVFQNDSDVENENDHEHDHNNKDNNLELKDDIKENIEIKEEVIKEVEKDKLKENKKTEKSKTKKDKKKKKNILSTPEPKKNNKLQSQSQSQSQLQQQPSPLSVPNSIITDVNVSSTEQTTTVVNDSKEPTPEAIKSRIQSLPAPTSTKKEVTTTKKPKPSGHEPVIAPWAKESLKKPEPQLSMKEILEQESSAKKKFLEQEKKRFKELSKHSSENSSSPSTSPVLTNSNIYNNNQSQNINSKALPSTAVWATAIPKQSSGPIKTLSEIRKEEESLNIRKKSIVSTSTPVKRYVEAAASVPKSSTNNGTSNSVWTTVGPGGKKSKPTAASIVAATIPSTKTISKPIVNSISSSISKPTIINTNTTSNNNNGSITREEFVKWCKGHLSGLKPGVNPDEFITLLLSIPSESIKLIEETIFDYSDTINGRRFAQEFIKRRKIVESSSSNKSVSSSGLSWSDLVSAPREQQDEDWSSSNNFTLVKKKGRR